MSKLGINKKMGLEKFAIMGGNIGCDFKKIL
jgi:hypothetical protein